MLDDGFVMDGRTMQGGAATLVHLALVGDAKARADTDIAGYMPAPQSGEGSGQLGSAEIGVLDRVREKFFADAAAVIAVAEERACGRALWSGICALEIPCSGFVGASAFVVDGVGRLASWSGGETAADPGSNERTFFWRQVLWEVAIITQRTSFFFLFLLPRLEGMIFGLEVLRELSVPGRSHVEDCVGHGEWVQVVSRLPAKPIL